jgi:hypothetical protein
MLATIELIKKLKWCEIDFRKFSREQLVGTANAKTTNSMLQRLPVGHFYNQFQANKNGMLNG